MKTLYKFDIEDGSIEFSQPCPNLPTSWLSPSWMAIGRAREGRVRQRATTTITNDVKGTYVEEGIIIKSAEEERKANIINDDGKEIITKSSGIGLEEESRHTSWDSLNQNILELISCHLPLLDYFHFRAVCRENRLATTTKMKHMQCASLSPWLIFLKAKDGVYNLAEPIHNDKFFISASDTLIDATIRYSKGGWLLMTKTNSRTIFFYNPFTRAMIHLPDLPDDFPVHNLSGLSFSSLPTSSDCVVMGIAVDWGFKEIWALSVTRGDDFWNYGDVENTIYLSSEELNVDFAPWRNNPVFYKEAFYCLDFNGKLGVSDARTGEWEILDLHGPCDSTKQSFLVECEGQLLAVFLSHSRTCVKVFRLDIDKKLWITVESLGKYMLFISNTSSLSAVAPNSRMENKIYFPRFHGEDIVYYSLDTCKYHTFGSQEYSGLDFYNTKEQLYCSWIEPNWSSTPAE